MSKVITKRTAVKKNRSGKKDLAHHLSLRYTIVLRPLSTDEGGGWFAEIPLLHGCWADGSTPDDAIQALSSARRVWTESMLAEGKTIPLP